MRNRIRDFRGNNRTIAEPQRNHNINKPQGNLTCQDWSTQGSGGKPASIAYSQRLRRLISSSRSGSRSQKRAQRLDLVVRLDSDLRVAPTRLDAHHAVYRRSSCRVPAALRWRKRRRTLPSRSASSGCSSGSPPCPARASRPSPTRSLRARPRARRRSLIWHIHPTAPTGIRDSSRICTTPQHSTTMAFYAS